MLLNMKNIYTVTLLEREMMLDYFDCCGSLHLEKNDCVWWIILVMWKCSYSIYMKCGHRPDFRFQDYVSEEMSSHEDQPKKLILRRHRDCTSLEEVCSQKILHSTC